LSGIFTLKYLIPQN